MSRTIPFEVRSLRGAPSGAMELNKVTVLIGSERKGAFKVAGALATAFLADMCNCLDNAFKKGLGVRPSQAFEGEGLIRLGETLVEVSGRGIRLERGEPPWCCMYYLPALRSVLLASLARMRELPVHFELVGATLIEALPAPGRLFLESISGADMCKSGYDLKLFEKVAEEYGLRSEIALNLGEMDERLLEGFCENLKPSSLMIVEEPSLFKTLAETVKEVKKYLRDAMNKDLTVFIATSRMATLYAVNELIGEGVFKAEDVSAYHITDDKIEKLEVAEEVGVSLSKFQLATDVAE